MRRRSFADALARSRLLAQFSPPTPVLLNSRRSYPLRGHGTLRALFKTPVKKEISTGLYVLMNGRSSGFCVRFDGILRAPLLYIPVVQVENL